MALAATGSWISTRESISPVPSGSRFKSWRNKTLGWKNKGQAALMNGVLLDTHALIWLYDPAPMSVDALVSIDLAAQQGSLYVSPISAWEVGSASRKKNPALRPRLRGLAPDDWWIEAIGALGVRVAVISEQIGLEACTLPTLYGHADPGDCFLVATAHVLQLTLITRDQRILEFSRRNSGHLSTVAC